jgi:ParB-like chromosome segregation protein Spo0J
MTNEIKLIAIDKLIPHPDNPNRMSKANFDKLVRNIERSGRYEPLVVRPCPDARGTRDDGRVSANPRPESQCTSVFQIINGFHRLQALKQLGYKTADVVVWDIDDHEADILLATLNRLGGKDILEEKLALLRRLSSKLQPRELAKLLPQTAKQIDRLTNLKLPAAPATLAANHFANPLVFFVNDTQQQIIEQALSLAKLQQNEKTKAAKRAAALTAIARQFLDI